MRLLRLLTAGKSLVGLKDSAGRYHVTAQRLLPQFGSDKNPFRATTLPEPASVAVARDTSVPARRAPVTELVAPVPSTPSPNPSRSPNPQAAADQPPAPQPHARLSTGKSAGRAWFGQCASKLAALLAPAPKPAKPALPRLAKTPVQGELSLDRIKVVRNDLSDSDLEVVPAKAPVTPSSPALVPVPAESAEPVEAAWSRVSTRLFGAGKTLT